MITGKQSQQADNFLTATATNPTHLDDFRQIFYIARVLKKYKGTEPEDFKGNLENYCKQANRDFEDFYVHFEDKWHQVKGDDLDMAFDRAIEKPIELHKLCDRSDNEKLFGSLLYHLSQLKQPNLFNIPTSLIAPLIGVNRDWIYATIRNFSRMGLIEVVKSHNPKTGDGRIFRWIDNNQDAVYINSDNDFVDF